MTGDDAIRVLRAAELPLLERTAYLDHATIGPLPRRHATAVAEIVQRIAEEGPEPGEGERLLEDVRGAAAALLHAAPERIALLKSTSEGLGLVARGLDWRVGDEVVVYERDFVGTLAPFVELARDGVVVRRLPDRGDCLDLDDLSTLLGPRTRAVCVSHVSREHGQRAPLAGLGALCRERDALLVVDAAQSLGVLDLDPAAVGADVVAAHGYKFLCAGFGLAVTWCSPRACALLRVPQVGWRNAALGDDGALSLGPDGAAGRFESTMPSFAALAGMRASLSLLAELEPVERERRAVGLADELAEGLTAAGWTVASSRRADERSSLVVAGHPALDAAAEVESLAARGVACAAVGDRLRFATHAFNLSADVDRLLEAIPTVAPSPAVQAARRRGRRQP